MHSRNRTTPLSLLSIVAIFLGTILSTFAQTPQLASPVDAEELWTSRIEPLLDKQCLKCHAGVRQQGSLDLRSLDTMLRGGSRGPAIIPGRPNESRLVQFVQPNSETHMPLDPKKQLSAADIAALKAWVSALPAPKSKLASATSTDTRWAAEYLADYQRSRQTRPTPPETLSPTATIDWLLQADWRRDKIVSARLCDDATFARRIYLDIAGRIPSKSELNQFLAGGQSDRRTRLVDKLIASEDYPRRLRELFDTALMGRPSEKNARERETRGWNAFLEESFRENRPWNDVVRDILLARPTGGTNRGAFWFIAERNNSHQAMAEAVAPVVFGVQIKCAQCHNHPLVWEIEQRHYWGLVATFNRSKNMETETGLGVSESAIGGFINFANLKKESQPAVMVFLNGKSVPERIPGAFEQEKDNADLYVVPPAKEGQRAHAPAIPKFSRREAFAEAVTRNNPQLSRAFVNRMWAVFMGRGIVQPVDQIDSRHRPSHPELLNWLSLDFEKSGYDIKRLVRNLVLTRAYQLDSKPSGKAPPRPESFARGLEKPLTAEQLLRSLVIATENRVEAKALSQMERAFTATFPDVMTDNYNPSLQQALFYTNSPILNGLLKPAPSNMTAKLAALPSPEARVQEAFRTVLGRSPDTTELQQCKSILTAQSPEKGSRNLLWALLTCTEFQVNH